MSSNLPHPFSPIHRRTTRQAFEEEGGRWTVDNSESRFHSIRAAQSPSRSILRGPSTPLRFGQSSQEKRNELLARRVSFARDAHLRVFDQNESPDVTSRDIPNLFEESQPDYIDNTLNSPSSNIFFSNSIGSPSDRKRRPDLFGSPNAVQKSPKRRVGGAPPSLLARMYDDNDEAADLTRYLSIQPGNTRRNIFEEDDDDEEEEDEEEKHLLPQSPLPSQPKLQPQSLYEPRPETQPESPYHSQPERQPERRYQSPYNPQPESQYQSPYNPQPERQPESPYQSPYNPQLESQPESPLDVTENIIERPIEDQTDMIITQEIQHRHIEREEPSVPFLEEEPSIPFLEEEPSIPFLEEETMLITQEMPSIFDSRLDTPDRNNRFTPQRFTHTPEVNRTISENGHIPTSPGRNGSTPQGSALSPENIMFTPPRLQHTPQRAQHTSPIHASPHRLSVLTPLRENHAVYSEQRSFLLHQGTPIRSNNSVTVEMDSSFDVGDNADIMEEEYSQLYNTLHDGISPAAQNMPLSEFLGYVGITFPDDPPAKDLRRRSHFSSDYGAATIAEQALAAALTLPELKFYKEEIKDLHELVHKSQDVIDRIDKEVSETNPQFFAEYLESDVIIRSKTEKRFKEIKTYATLKSIQQWYTLWLDSLKSLPITLKKNLDKLEIDIEEISKFQQKIKPKFEEINEYKKKLEDALKEYKLEEQKYDEIDHEKLDSFEREIEYQRLAIQDLNEEAELLEKQENDLSTLDKALENEMAQLLEIVKQAETSIESCKCVTVEQLVEEKYLFETNSKMGGWKMEKPEDDIVHMGLDHNIDIIINQTKLTNKQPDAVFIRMLESKDRTLGPLAELIHGLTVIARDKWDIDEIMQDIAIYWNRVMMIQRDLSHVQRRYWIAIEPLEYDDAKDAGFSCQICAYSFVGKTKFTIEFQVKPKDVMAYPAIDISTLSLVIHYGGVEHDDLKDLIEKELSSHGMLKLVDTVIGIVERIAIPE